MKSMIKSKGGRSPVSEDLREVVKSFRAWRRGKAHAREPIPQRLWKAAVDQARHYGVYQTAKALGLDSSELKRRLHGRDNTPENGSSPRFVQMPWPLNEAPAQCTVEWRKTCGDQMSVRLDCDPAKAMEVLIQAFNREGQ